MIKDLLPRYYEAHKNSVVYGVGLIQSSIINGHEVAWMEYRGITINGQPFVGRAIHCECDFTEGVGWEVNPKYGVVSIHRSKGCRPRRKFIYRRRAELHRLQWRIGWKDLPCTTPVRLDDQYAGVEQDVEQGVGSLGDARQDGRLCQAQVFHMLGEVFLGRGFHAIGPVTQEDMVQVEVQNLFLGHRLFFSSFRKTSSYVVRTPNGCHSRVNGNPDLSL